MPEIKVTQTYNIDVNPEIYAFAKNFILNDNDQWFKLRLQKIHADSLSIKTLGDGFVNGVVKATAYLNIIPDFNFGNDLGELVTGKVSFVLNLNKVKISSLKDCFELKVSHDTEIDLDLDFNSKISQKGKDFFAREIFKIINQADFKVNIEQTVSKIEYTEK